MNKVSDHTPASWCWSRWCSRYAAASPGTQDGVSSWQPGFGLPSLWSALLAPCKLNLWNTIYLLWWSKPKVDAAASTFPPTTVGLFCQTLSVKRDHLDLFFWALLLDMTFLGTHQLRGGVYIYFFYKVSFEKHPNVHDLDFFLVHNLTVWTLQ